MTDEGRVYKHSPCEDCLAVFGGEPPCNEYCPFEEELQEWAEFEEDRWAASLADMEMTEDG